MMSAYLKCGRLIPKPIINRSLSNVDIQLLEVKRFAFSPAVSASNEDYNGNIKH